MGDGLFSIYGGISGVLFFALGAAEQIVLTACNKRLLAILAKFQRFVHVSQHETEHHLDSQQQGTETPENAGRTAGKRLTEATM